VTQFKILKARSSPLFTKNGRKNFTFLSCSLIWLNHKR